MALSAPVEVTIEVMVEIPGWQWFIVSQFLDNVGEKIDVISSLLHSRFRSF